jgi:hypothetical protein
VSEFLDVEPDAVSAAGRNTAGTSTQWGEWASRVETGLRTAAVEAHESVVTAAIEEHLSAWNPRLHGMATNADALGRNAVSASNVVSNADGESAAMLGQQGALAYGTAGHLSRPIAY